MAILRGTYGKVQVATDTTTLVFVDVASRQNWTWDETNETYDTTVMGATRVRTSITTFYGATATASGFWDDEDLAAAEGQGIVRDASISGNEIVVRIYPSATAGSPTTGDEYYQMNCYVSGDNLNGGYDNAVQQSMTFVGSGAVTHGQHAP